MRTLGFVLLGFVIGSIPPVVLIWGVFYRDWLYRLRE